MTRPINFSYSDDVALDVLWEAYQKTLMENIQLKAQLKTAEETVRRIVASDPADTDEIVD